MRDYCIRFIMYFKYFSVCCNFLTSFQTILAPGNPEPELAYCDGYTAKIKWKKPSGIIHHYNVCYRYAGVEHDKVLQTKMQEITLSDLQKGSVYSLTVQSVSNENSSIQSKVIEFSTGMVLKC